MSCLIPKRSGRAVPGIEVAMGVQNGLWRVAAQDRAFLFDMDGTLIDSEINTERVVAAALKERGICAVSVRYL